MLQLTICILAILLQVVGHFLQILQLLLLNQGFILQPLVLSLNVALNLGDVLLCLSLGLGIFVLEFLVERVLNLVLLGLLLSGAVALDPLQLLEQVLVTLLLLPELLLSQLLRLFELLQRIEVRV